MLDSTKEPLTADRFAAAYGTGYHRTVRFLHSSCGLARLEAEEFAQAAWVQGWESRATLRDAAALPAWVNTIALNLFRGDRRTAWRRGELLYDPTINPSPMAGIEAAEVLRVCSLRDSRLLVNRYLFGYSTNELASQEKVGNIAIRVRLSRARKQIRESRAKEHPVAA